MFFLAEYINMFTVSALATTLFLGGWQAPARHRGDQRRHVQRRLVAGLLWFVVKLWLFMFFFVWLRGTLPRVRYDQFMRFGWKVLIPVALLWVVAVAVHPRRPAHLLRRRHRRQVVLVIGRRRHRGRSPSSVGLGLGRPARRAARRRRTASRRRSTRSRAATPSRRCPASACASRRWPTSAGRRRERTVTDQGGHPWLTRRRPDAKTGGFLSDLFAPVAGFGVTFATMFRKLETEEYPEEKRPTQPRFHGRHQLNRHPDGLEKCIGCELCAWACPADAIYVEGADNTEDARFSPGERYGRVYQINYLRCIFCGLCIEACPTRALTMTNEYELADDNRARPDLREGAAARPAAGGHARRRRTRWSPGIEERDYYHGKVTEADARAAGLGRAHEPQPAQGVPRPATRSRASTPSTADEATRTCRGVRR